jgi:hypothetical protein
LPRAAPANNVATWRHVDFSRVSAGKCFSISVRTSASVLSVMTLGMTIGRGRGRDQFGRGQNLLLRNATMLGNGAQIKRDGGCANYAAMLR